VKAKRDEIASHVKAKRDEIASRVKAKRDEIASAGESESERCTASSMPARNKGATIRPRGGAQLPQSN
jgi:uncharacterized coiled-coil DUF342 family protein